MESIAERLVATRKKRNVTQKELARLIGVAQGTISAIEIGKTAKPLNLIAIANVLNVNAWWLYTGEGQEAGMIDANNLKRAAKVSIEELIRAGEELTPERIAEVLALVCEMCGLASGGQEWNEMALKIAVQQALQRE